MPNFNKIHLQKKAMSVASFLCQPVYTSQISLYEILLCLEFFSNFYSETAKIRYTFNYNPRPGQNIFVQQNRSM